LPETGGKPLEEYVVRINRCATVVKGGRRFSFSALVVVGDRNGRVGYGFGKAKEVALAVEKGGKEARRNVAEVSIVGDSIPHEILARYGASRVFMKPASPGTGIIAGSTVRAVVEAAGIRDILTKVYGNATPVNLVKATINGLKSMRTKEEVERLRGVKIE